MKTAFTFFLITFFTGSLLAQKIGISIFNELSLQTILVTPTKGTYKLVVGSKEITLELNQIVYISKVGDSILVRDANKNLGNWSRVTIIGQTGEDELRLKSILPSFPARLYDDNLSFYVDFKRIMAINLVDQEKYVSAVVEAEAGPKKESEFYKAQSLIVRTFALAHLNKHQGEGFNLCDGVHCQVYKGKTGMDKNIYQATLDTKGQVIVDDAMHLITAAFHSNCGGWTANSEDVWLKPLPYLRSVEDRYCLSGRNSIWEVRIPLDVWVKFLVSKGLDSSKVTDIKEYNFSSKTRPLYYTAVGLKIPMTQIREHFKFRSAFFGVEVVKNNIKITGRGYGHGVGLCQEGAMSMANRGWTYDKIIDHYYKGAKIINFSDIPVIEPADSVERDISIIIP